jgi:hypothetical protein
MNFLVLGTTIGNLTWYEFGWNGKFNICYGSIFNKCEKFNWTRDRSSSKWFVGEKILVFFASIWVLFRTCSSNNAGVFIQWFICIYNNWYQWTNICGYGRKSIDLAISMSEISMDSMKMRLFILANILPIGEKCSFKNVQR